MPENQLLINGCLCGPRIPCLKQSKENTITKVGTWEKITVLKGKPSKFVELTEDGEEVASHIFEAGADNPMAQLQAWHRVEALQMMWEWFWNLL